MKTDTFLKQGSTHYICEDYIDSNNNLIALSDGCSSSTNTDFGSRVLVRKALSDYKSLMKESYDFVRDNWIKDFVYDKIDLGFKDETYLDATLLLLKDNRITIFGDGFFFYKKKNKDLEIVRIEYNSGAPYYLSYSINSDREKEYHKIYGTGIDITNVCIKNNQEVSNIEGLSYNPRFLEYNIDTTDLELIGIASDGLDTFTEEGNYIPFQKIVSDICNFRSYKGEIVKRRINKLFKRDWKNYDNYDDISIGINYYEGEK